MKQTKIWLFAAALIACTADIAIAEHPDKCEAPKSIIAFSSNRHDPAGIPALNTGDIYLMDVDENGMPLFVDANGMSDPQFWQQLMGTDFDGFPALSPDGKGRIAFDSNRFRRSGERLNTSDLFLMNHDGSEQTHLIRGGSPSWSPDAKRIAFHASASFHASGSGTLPIKTDPGAATFDSDIFIAKVKDLLKGKINPKNITNSPDIDDDPDWSPDGKKIAFTRHPKEGPHDNSITAEIYALNVKKGKLERLTFNEEEERAPAWSPDGRRIAYICRRGPLNPQGLRTFEICVMDLKNRDQSGFPVATQLTNNLVFDGAPHWSPDGKKIVFSRMQAAGRQQIWVMDLEKLDPSGFAVATQLTNAPTSTQLFATWGQICADNGDDENDENEDEQDEDN
jgi:TolB protein